MGLSTTIPSVAIKKLIPVLQSQLMKLIDISSLIEIAINSLPLTVKCNDPRVQDIKQQLANVKQLLDTIDKLKKAMAKLTSTFNIISGVAVAVEVVQLAIPAVPGVPQGPFAKLAIIAATLGKNCSSAGACLSSIVMSIDLAVAKLESVLAFAIIKLTSICVNQTFIVNKNVQTEILKLTVQPVQQASIIDTTGAGPETNITGFKSRFYNKYNVSQDDLDALDTIVYDLNDLELTVTDYLKEAPAKVYSGTTLPDPKVGKQGDFYNDLTNQTVYGPKPLDGTWNDTPIKY